MSGVGMQNDTYCQHVLTLQLQHWICPLYAVGSKGKENKGTQKKQGVGLLKCISTRMQVEHEPKTIRLRHWIHSGNSNKERETHTERGTWSVLQQKKQRRVGCAL